MYMVELEYITYFHIPSFCEPVSNVFDNLPLNPKDLDKVCAKCKVAYICFASTFHLIRPIVVAKSSCI